MKTKFRIYSIALAVIMIVAMLTPCTPFVEASLLNNDMFMVDLLKLIEVYEETDLVKTNSEEAITKAEMVYYTVRLLGINIADLGSAFKKIYEDVSYSHPYASAITIAYDKGIISPAQLFYPDKKVTLIEAVKMLVSALGYGAYALENGGYPVGYLSVAKSRGLLDGIKLQNGSTIAFMDMTRLLFNALHADIMEQVAFGTYVEFRSVKDYSLLNKIYKIYYDEGQILQSNISSVSSDEVLQDGKVKIADVIYHVEDSQLYQSICNYLGYNITYYYKDDQADRELIYFTPTNNEVITIFSEDFVGYEKGIIYYEDNHRVQKQVIPADAAVLYNGKAVTELFDESLFEQEWGDISLIDAGRNGKTNVVRISSYENYVVGAVDSENFIVYDAYEEGKKLDLSKNGKLSNLVRLRSKTGEILDFGSIVKGTVLSVAASRDKQYFDIIVVTDKIIGVAEDVTYSKNDIIDTVYVDGNEYKVAANVYSDRTVSIKAGETYTFGLDAGGRIAFIESHRLYNGGYVFLIDAKESGTGLSNRVDFRIMDNNGRVVVLQATEKLIIDGEQKRNSSEILAALSPNGYVASQPVDISLNEDGEIIAIDTPYVGIAEEETDSLQMIYSSKGGTVRYKRTPRMFMSYFGVSSNTKVFIHPEDSAQKADDKEYLATGISYFRHDSTYIVNAYARNPNSPVADIVTVVGSAGVDISSQDQIMVVKKISYKLDEEEKAVIALTGYYEGKLSTFYIEEPSVLTIPRPGAQSENDVITIGEGDAIRFVQDNLGYITKINIYYDFSESISYANNKDMDNHVEFQVVCGPIYIYRDGFITLYNKLDISDDTKEKRTFTGSGYRVYVVEGHKDRPIIRLGGISDLKDIYTYGSDYSEVLLHLRYYDPRTMVIYQKDL